MICAAAVIVAFLGAMPAKGTVVVVPRSSLSQYTPAQVAKARACAKKYGIQYRVDENL